jgi:hypothetical protein
MCAPPACVCLVCSVAVHSIGMNQRFPTDMTIKPGLNFKKLPDYPFD